MHGDAVFYPYGLARGGAVGARAAGRLPAGAAEVQDAAGRASREIYVLERSAAHWQLRSRLCDGPELLLARMERKPRSVAGTVAGELIESVWALRDPGRLRFSRLLDAGALGAAQWRRIAERLTGAAPLEQALRAEGHAVRTARGPIGTTEHILLLRRA